MATNPHAEGEREEPCFRYRPERACALALVIPLAGTDGQHLNPVAVRV